MYSPVKFDVLTTGSADSTLRMLEYWDLAGPCLVFPTDTVIDFDLEPMYRSHLESGAAVTVAAMTRAPTQVAEKYGLMLTGPDGRILEFVEKPTMAELREFFVVHDDSEFDQLPLLTNAGFYLVDAKVLREVAGQADIAALRRTRLDFGKDLLPWLVGNGTRCSPTPCGGSGTSATCRTIWRPWWTPCTATSSRFPDCWGRRSTRTAGCGSPRNRSRCVTH